MRTTSDHSCAVGGLLTPGGRASQRDIASTALRCLRDEIVLYPKPGLVSLVDNGSHADMDASTFFRSLFSLRHYFADIGAAGARHAPFATLRQLGIDAERRMLRATGGINTHRGAIFSLGLLCAAKAALHGRPTNPEALRAQLLLCWGRELGAHSGVTGASSNGLRAAARHGASGAREEGARGLPSVFEVGVPALRRTLAAGRGMREARVDAIFALMAHMSDTNVYHRGGAEGALFVTGMARDFCARGGSADPAWEERAIACHHAFVARRLSPGGAADLLAASCFVHEVTA